MDAQQTKNNAWDDANHDVWDDQSSTQTARSYTDNPKVIIKDSPIHGLGVFARVDIPAFGYIGRYEGPSTDIDGMHVLWLYDDETESWYGVDGINEMRFLNHSDTPNAEWSDLDLYATRFIEAGEEITFDYGWGEDEDEDEDGHQVLRDLDDMVPNQASNQTDPVTAQWAPDQLESLTAPAPIDETDKS